MRREYWSADRWLSYGERLHRISWLIWEAVGLIGNAKGRVCPAIDAGLAVGNKVELAMVTLESIVAEHFGGWKQAPPPLDQFVQHWFDAPKREAPDRPRRSILSREEWVTIGNLVKDAWNLRNDLSVEFGNECRGKDRARHQLRLRQVERSMLTFKCKLDSLVVSQHPDWKEATRVFYGPNLELAEAS